MAIIGTPPNQIFQRTDGVRTGAAVNEQARIAGVNDTAELADARENDIASALNIMVMKTGGNTASSNLPMGGYRHTGVGNATASDQYAAKGQMDAGDAATLASAHLYLGAPIGTAILCFNPTAPTGWVIEMSHHDKAIRLVTSGAGNYGGSTAFSSVFASRTVPLPVLAEVSGRGAGGGAVVSSVRGSRSEKALPSPGALATETAPPLWRTKP